MPLRPLTPEEKEQGNPPCISPKHDPPTMMVYPPGVHVWVCPACGNEIKFTVGFWS